MADCGLGAAAGGVVKMFGKSATQTDYPVFRAETNLFAKDLDQPRNTRTTRKWNTNTNQCARELRPDFRVFSVFRG